jgi:hypothetical protein
MKAEETENEIKRLLRVFSLRGSRHRTIWTPFEITNSGIIITRDYENRCVLCSKPIYWEPYEETIGGTKYQFDRKECATTYKKLKDIYGQYFE